MKLSKIFCFEEFKSNENLTWDDKAPKIKYEVGNRVVYLYKDKDIDDWMDLTEDERKNPEEAPASEVVGVKKIDGIEGDEFSFTDKEGKKFTKQKKDIIMKIDGGGEKKKPTKESFHFGNSNLIESFKK